MTPDTTVPIPIPESTQDSTPPAPSKAERRAALKAEYPDHRIVSFKDEDTIIVVRRPTEAEVLTIFDKDRIASKVEPGSRVYNYDNGNAETLGLVVFPDPRTVERMEVRRPTLPNVLWKEVMALCPLPIVPVTVTEAEKKKSAALAFLLEGKTRILLRGMTRPKYEEIDFGRLKSAHKLLLPSVLAGMAKRNLLAPVGPELEGLWDRHPFLSNLFGQWLWGEMSLEVETEEGE